jgi:multiple sugar transport system substrate-binding protein
MKHRSLSRIASIGAVALVTAVVLAGCSSAGTPTATASSKAKAANTTGQTLNYWLWQDDPTDQTWAKLAKEFNAQSGHGKVALQVIPLAQYEDKLSTAISSGTGPDAARMKDEWVGEFAQAKALAPLSPLINAWSGKSNVIPSAWASGEVPGSSEVYMMPHQNVALYMYYNKTLFAKAGLKAPKTQADVLADAPKLTGNGSYAMDIRGGAGGQDQWAAWMYAGGAQFVDAKGKVTLDNATAVKINQNYLDLNKYAPPGSTTATFAQVESNFLSGKTALMIHHVGSLAAVRAQFGSNVGVIPIPSANPKKPSTLQTMSGNAILASSKKQTLAWQWISWLDTNAPMLQMSTSPQGQLPVTESVAKNAFFTKDDGYKVAITSEATAQSWPRLPGTSTVVNVTWPSTIQSAFAKQVTSSAALKTLATALAK